MFTSTPPFSLVSALVDAGAYAGAFADGQLTVHAVPPIPFQALADINHARVEIYCGHNASAVADIRAACECLRSSAAAVPAETFAALDRAAWLTRHDQCSLAQLALEGALAHIVSGARRQ